MNEPNEVIKTIDQIEAGGTFSTNIEVCGYILTFIGVKAKDSGIVIKKKTDTLNPNWIQQTDDWQRHGDEVV